MKNISLLLITLSLLSCADSNTSDTSDAWDGVERIGEYDGGSGVLNPNGDDEGSEVVSSVDDHYACAKVYLQIPFEVRDPETNEITITLSHQLWSVPVRKSIHTDNDKWHAVQTDFNIAVPNAGNVDFNDDGEAYAILILEDGSVLYDQVVVPTSNDSWQVCESLYCGPAGCQSHEDFDHENWQCHVTQNRIDQQDIPDKCPCIFNDTGYPYCDTHYGETEE